MEELLLEIGAALGLELTAELTPEQKVAAIIAAIEEIRGASEAEDETVAEVATDAAAEVAPEGQETQPLNREPEVTETQVSVLHRGTKAGLKAVLLSGKINKATYDKLEKALKVVDRVALLSRAKDATKVSDGIIDGLDMLPSIDTVERTGAQRVTLHRDGENKESAEDRQARINRRAGIKVNKGGR